MGWRVWEIACRGMPCVRCQEIRPPLLDGTAVDAASRALVNGEHPSTLRSDVLRATLSYARRRTLLLTRRMPECGKGWIGKGYWLVGAEIDALQPQVTADRYRRWYGISGLPWVRFTMRKSDG